jgi:aryl-alcohol dehydrogenase-like predicted oxidoreductase
MHYRKLGNTGLEVSEIGFGCNRLGEPDRPAEHWVALVRKAVDLGVTLFDSSESYGWGASEDSLGRGLEGIKDVVVATKVSRIQETNAKDFSAARIVKQAEGCLKRLRRDVIDIFQLHSPSREDMERFDWVDGLEKLRKDGKIRFPAVAINNAADGVWLIRKGYVRALQLTYNIFETDAEAELFALAGEKGVGLMGRMPIAQGILSGKFKPGADVPKDHRAHLAGNKMAKLIELAEQLRPVAASYPGGMARMAHHFALSPSAMSATIPGARTIEQLADNVAASNGVGLDKTVRARIDAIRAGWGSLK